MPICPWSGYAPATISFCERRLCAWIVEPTGAWSNLGYLLVGIYLFFRASGRGPLRTVGVAAALIGFGSFAFHATGTRIGEVMDVSSMYLLGALGGLFALARIRPMNTGTLVGLYALTVALSILLLIATGSNGILIFSAQVALTVWGEVYLLRVRREHADRRPLLLCGAAFALAFAIWGLDKSGLVCNPDNHLFNGHSAWHLLTALAIYFLYRYEEPFFPINTALRAAA
jgi:hypothetical protein